MKQIVCICVVCDSVFSSNFDEGNTDNKVVTSNIKIFQSCTKYLNVELDKISDDLKFDLNCEPLPFCASCLLPAHKILTLHEQIETLTQEINAVVTDLKTSIFKCYYDKNTSSRQTGRNKKKVAEPFLKKTAHYRHLVVSDSSKVSSQHPDFIGAEEIKSEPLPSSALEDESFNDDFLDCEIPSVHSTFEGYSSEEDVENQETKKPRVSITPSKLSDSIVALLKLHGMDKRKLVIKLHRTKKIKESAEVENSADSSRRRRGRPAATEVKKTLVLEKKDGRVFYSGVEMIMGDEDIECGNCKRKFPSERSIRRHIEQVHRAKRKRQSTKSVEEIERITSHNRKYRMRKKLGLTLQNRIFTKTKIIQRNGKLFFCGVPMIDLQQDGKWECGKCNKKSNSRYNLKRHILAYHDPIYREEVLSKLPLSANGNRIYLGSEIVEQTEEQFTCGTCWKNFHTMDYIQKHIQRNHPELNENAAKKPSNSDDDNDSDGKSEDSDSEIDISSAKEDSYFTNTGLVYKGIFCTKLKGGSKGYRCGFRLNSDSPICNVEFLTSIKLFGHLQKIHLKNVKVEADTYNSDSGAKVPHINPIHSRNVLLFKKKNTVIERDGKKFYCDAEIIQMKDGQIRCGKCERLFETLRSVCRHIEMAHWVNRKKPNPRKTKKCMDEARKNWQQKRKELGLSPGGNKSKAEREKGSGHDRIYFGIELVDTKDGEFACGSCWQTFKELHNLKTHVRLHHSSSTAKTDVTNPDGTNNPPEEDNTKNERAYYTEDGFMYNGVFCEKLDGDGGFKCGYCDHSSSGKLADYEFSTTYVLVRHIRAAHSDKTNENVIKVRNQIVTMEDGRTFFVGIEIIDLKDGRWECGKCKKQSISQDAIKYHIYEYHDAAYRQLKFFKKIDDGSSGIEKRNFDGVDITSKEGQLICGACWRTFPTMIVIKRHIRKRHADLRSVIPETEEEPRENQNGDESSAENSQTDSEDLALKNETKTLKNEDKAEDVTVENESDKGKSKKTINSKKSGKAATEKSKTKEDSYFTAEGFIYNGTLCKKFEEGEGYKCGFRRYNGANCTSEFQNTFNLVKHINTKHLFRKTTAKLKKVNETIITEDGRKLFGGVEMIAKDEDHLQCGGCQKVFRKNQLSSLMGHILRIHQTDGAYVCDKCDPPKTFGYKHYYEKHMTIHKEERGFMCEDCGISYKQPSSLIHHKRQVHLKIKRHTCKICGKGYYHTRDFIIHQRRHTGEKPFQCCVCGRNFVSEYDMKAHEKSHKKSDEIIEKPLEKQKAEQEEKVIPKRRRRPTGKSTIKKSRRGRFECEYCDEDFTTMAAAKKHMREDHTDTESETEDKHPLAVVNNAAKDEKYVPNGSSSSTNIKPFPPVNYSSPQKMNSSPCSSWSTPNSDFSMPVLENMHSAVQDQANAAMALEHHLLSLGHGAFPPTLMPMYRHGPY